MLDLSTKPFYLNDSESKWVIETYENMNLQERVGQLFCMIGMSSDESYLESIIKNFAPGGIMFRPLDMNEIQSAHNYLQKNSNIPLLTAANLEAGGNGIVNEGTMIGNPMGIAATNNIENARNWGKNVVLEASSVGVNWAFAPIVDIDLEFRNPITNTRTFGSNVETIISFADAYNQELIQGEMAVSIKHFPGDGVDERDQHLVTSVNSLDVDQYKQSYGKIYTSLIERGAQTVMAGHIYQPALERSFNPNLTDKELMPGSLSKYLLKDYLRGELGFNGLIVSDASLMVGMTSLYPRCELPARCIAAGCDMFLFTKNPQEDFQSMLDGISMGILSETRLKEAVYRILALKASLKLHTKDLQLSEDLLVNIGSKESKMAEWKVADEAITLVKDKQNLLPLSVTMHKRILIWEQSNISMMGPSSNCQIVGELLEQKGFDITKLAIKADDIQQVGTLMMAPIREFTKKYDLILYLFDYKNASNNTTLRVNYNPSAMFLDMPTYINEIPTMAVSIAYPYHLFDVPFMKTYINTYSNNRLTLELLVDKMLGNSEFKGISPIDPFCGRWDTKL